MNLDGKNILVIGGAGFIGSHIIDLLLKTRVNEIKIYDNFSRGKLSNLQHALKDSRAKIIEADILDYNTLERASQSIDGIFHLAAIWLLECHENPRLGFDVNMRGTFNVLLAAMKHKIEKVVFSSSASVYGNALTIPMTEDHPYNNFTFYGATKIAGEHMFKAFGDRYQIPWIGLRYMNVYGPRQDYKGVYTAVMHKMLDRIEMGDPPIIHGDGLQEYDFIDARDVARCNILAMQSNKVSQCYNVCSGKGTSLNKLAHILLHLKKSQLEVTYEKQSQTFVTKRIGCPEMAKSDLGFACSINLETGLKDLINWRLHN